ncbi:MAG: hypothetical protein A3K10_07735 [Bacteroidetes bacterium RIFCSPLOWO2_12_FULL_31_6]|nr:MAG: hypothetical protein A3K10_07735 [Bacteroidetes bacterium RIFCSPLOWO2_12_FULL_31_6]
MKFIPRLKELITGRQSLNSADAYNKWAENYDEEQNNLMLYYDKIILSAILNKVDPTGKNILDYGCGTGRNWKEILNNSGMITGCDISKEMLERLKIKYPDADVHLLKNDKLTFLPDNSVDILISTLVVAHIKNLEPIFIEWDRVIKENGEIIITDFHPTLLEKGGERTFNHKNEIFKIKNYIHNISEIVNLLGKFGFRRIQLIEQNINEEVRPFYESRNSVKVYEKFYNSPFIYGILLRR